MRSGAADDIDRAMRNMLQTDDGMARFLDALFGHGAWIYDPTEDVWVVPDKDYSGPGRKFCVVKRGGAWFEAVLPPSAETC